MIVTDFFSIENPTHFHKNPDDKVIMLQPKLLKKKFDCYFYFKTNYHQWRRVSTLKLSRQGVLSWNPIAPHRRICPEFSVVLIES